MVKKESLVLRSEFSLQLVQCYHSTGNDNPIDYIDIHRGFARGTRQIGWDWTRHRTLCTSLSRVGRQEHADGSLRM